MKIKIIKSFRPNPYKGPLEVGNELEVRLLPGSPFNLYRPYQVVEGKYSGEEVPITHCVLLPEEKSYTEQQYTELKQENLQRLEEVKFLQRHVNSIDAYAKKKAEQNRILRHDSDLLYGDYKKLQTDNGLLAAALERAMLDHQPVVLSKELDEAIIACKKVMSGIQIVSSLDNINQLFRDYDELVLRSLSVIKYFAQKEIGGGQDLMSALVNGYTVESPEDAAINEVAGMLNKWANGDYVTEDSVEEENMKFAKEIIDCVKAHSK